MENNIDRIKIICNLIRDRANKNPELRFIQLLWSLDIVSNEDRFYENTKTTLERIYKRIQEEETSKHEEANKLNEGKIKLISCIRKILKK